MLRLRPLTAHYRAVGNRVISSGHSQRRQCPKCGARLPSPLPACPACRYIASVGPEISYEQLLDVPVLSNPFVIEQEALRKAFLKSQQLCHPDNWQVTGQANKVQLASEQSTLLNRAYTTLKDPLLRAQYLIAQRGGIEMRETEKLEDPDMVMSVMEASEEVECADTPDALGRAARVNNDRIQAAIELIEEKIGSGNWREAHDATVRLKFWEGIRESIRQRYI